MQQCDKCDKTFDEVGLLNRHKLTHSTFKGYKCMMCNDWFKRKDKLKDHSCRDYFSCCKCEKQFRFRRGLQRHMKTHEGIVFECSVCNKTFSQNNNLKRHLKSHDQAIFKCGKCDKIFSRKDNMLRHELLKHSDSEERSTEVSEIKDAPNGHEQRKKVQNEVPNEH